MMLNNEANLIVYSFTQPDTEPLNYPTRRKQDYHYTTDATSGTITAYHSVAPAFTPGF